MEVGQRIRSVPALAIVALLVATAACAQPLRNRHVRFQAEHGRLRSVVCRATSSRRFSPAALQVSVRRASSGLARPPRRSGRDAALVAQRAGLEPLRVVEAIPLEEGDGEG